MGLTFQRTLVDPAGLGRDAPFDVGPDSDKALLFLILSELRVLNQTVHAMAIGQSEIDELQTLRKDNLIEPDFMRQPL